MSIRPAEQLHPFFIISEFPSLPHYEAVDPGFHSQTAIFFPSRTPQYALSWAPFPGACTPRLLSHRLLVILKGWMAFQVFAKIQVVDHAVCHLFPGRSFHSSAIFRSFSRRILHLRSRFPDFPADFSSSSSFTNSSRISYLRILEWEISE